MGKFFKEAELDNQLKYKVGLIHHIESFNVDSTAKRHAYIKAYLAPYKSESGLAVVEVKDDKNKKTLAKFEAYPNFMDKEKETDDALLFWDYTKNKYVNAIQID